MEFGVESPTAFIQGTVSHLRGAFFDGTCLAVTAYRIWPKVLVGENKNVVGGERNAH
jgi:hypothetical protein